MANINLHRLRRVSSFLFEAACLVAVLVLVGWGLLVWRLSQGPLDVGFAIPYLEKAFHAEQEDFDFRVTSARLVWGGKLEPFYIDLGNLSVLDRAGETVLQIEKVGIRLSKRNLLIARIVPRTIKVYQPVLHLIRREDGSFGLDVETPQTPAAEKPKAATNRTALIESILRQLREEGGISLLGGLREVEIQDAELIYEDHSLDVLWRAKNAQFSLERAREGIEVHADVAVDMDSGASAPAVVQAAMLYDWQKKNSNIDIAFSGIVPARLGQQSKSFAKLAKVDLPLQGSIKVALDKDFRLAATRFVLGSGEGSFAYDGLYDAPLPIKSFYAAGEADIRRMAGKLDELKIDFGGPKIEAKAVSVDENGVKIVTANAVLTEMPMDDLHQFWSPKLAPDAQGWVTKNLKKGIAHRATLNMQLAYDPKAEEGKRVSLRDLGGEIDFTGIRVDYFNPLPPATEAKGRATYDKTSFNIDVTGGRLQDMDVNKAVIHITELDQQTETRHAKFKTSIALSGPLKTALHVLDSKPLEYPKMLGLKTAEVGGMAKLDLDLAFPLHNALDLPELQVIAKAKADNVLLKDIVSGLSLSGGPMDVLFENSRLNVRGSGRLADMPITFDWKKHFSGAGPAMELQAKLPLNAAALQAFGLPAEMKMEGVVPADIEYTEEQDGKGVLKGKGSVTEAAFAVPAAAYQKPLGMKGQLAVTLNFLRNQLTSVASMDLAADNLSVRGGADFKSDGSLVKARLIDVRLGETRVSADVDNLGAAGYQVKVTGKQLDVSGFFKDDPEPNSDAEAAKKQTPLKINLAVDRLITGKNKGLENVKLFMQRNAWQRIDQIELKALAGGKDFSVSYLPQSTGHTLRVDAGNAGAALSALGLVNSIRGGRLEVSGKTPQGGGPRDLKGTAAVTNFTLKDAPVIARLLNAMSLPGILSLLSGEGISFKKARVDYTWTDRGQPQQAQNVRMIRLKDGKTSGASLGLMFEGSIDNWKNTYDLNGTIVPVSEVTNVIGVIPIIGDILTAGGEGLIAATYTIRGPAKDPTVIVNPLSVLAPGILRKIFFE